MKNYAYYITAILLLLAFVTIFNYVGCGGGGGGSSAPASTSQKPSVTTNPATDVTVVSAILNGIVNPKGFATDVYFEYGITTTPITYPISTTLQSIGNGTTSVAVSATVNSLSSNILYNFRCVATNAEGTTQGTNRTFGNWSQTTFSSSTGVFADTAPATSNNDVTLVIPNWLQRHSTTFTPTARYQYAMAYDSVRQKTVLFGGDTGVEDNETWEWDGTDWTQRFPSTSPSARSAHAMAYDSVRQKTVLFGGFPFNNQTWEWDGTDWLQRYSTTVTPSGRYLHAMAYDSVRQRTVLFGGYPTTVDGDTWEWDGTDWLQRYSTTVTPAGRCYHAIAYDSVRQRTVLFGGFNNPVSYNDTWEWDGTDWLQRYSTTVTPSERSVHAMAYDSIRQKTIIFGGDSGSLNNETWEWDGTDWMQRITSSGLTVREGCGMAYDSLRQRTVIFGGYPYNNETWEYGLLYASSGTYVSPPIVSPSSISSWGIVTFTYNASANTTFSVDILNSTNDSVLLTNVSSGTDLSAESVMSGVQGIKLRANFATTDTNVTPTLFDWGIGFEGLFLP
ncbi:MAG: hypothetical protein V1709_08525 [Planctomycetota bacterium]